MLFLYRMQSKTAARVSNMLGFEVVVSYTCRALELFYTNYESTPKYFSLWYIVRMWPSTRASSHTLEYVS